MMHHQIRLINSFILLKALSRCIQISNLRIATLTHASGNNFNRQGFQQFRIRIRDIGKITNLLSPVNRGTVFSNTYMVPSTQRLYIRKNVAGTIAQIFSIDFLVSPGPIAQETIASPRS